MFRIVSPKKVRRLMLLNFIAIENDGQPEGNRASTLWK